MNVVEKAIVISAVVVGLGLVLTNPTGTAAAGTASGNVMTAWFKGLWGKS